LDPAVRAAGLEHRPPYALRHSYASFAIAAGMPLFDLARFMGTSVEQLDRTYRHLLPDSLDRGRIALETFLGRAEQENARGESARESSPMTTLTLRPPSTILCV
jgi:hypothetical protein